MTTDNAPTGSIDPVLQGQLTATPPAKASEVIQQQVSSQDYVILRFAVVGLTLIAVIAIVGSLFLIRENNEVQAGVTAIIALGGVAVGGLVTMLTRVPLVPIVSAPVIMDR